MSEVRQPAVAGSFYPASGDGCSATIDRFLGEADPPAGADPRALIAPHAGYRYSGPVAASAYVRLARGRPPRRVIILGPAHTVPIGTMAATAADAWVTPLGEVAIDVELRSLFLECADTSEDDWPHETEHALEVQLPFLQRVVPDFTCLPVVVGAVRAEVVAAMLDHVWRDDETLVVISTDLSHYHDHLTAARRDRRTADAICSLEAAEISPDDACGAYPLRGLLRHARGHGLGIEQLDLRSSGDTAGPRDRVVGYGAFVVTDPPAN